jgi:hypothetical protein
MVRDGQISHGFDELWRGFLGGINHQNPKDTECVLFSMVLKAVLHGVKWFQVGAPVCRAGMKSTKIRNLADRIPPSIPKLEKMK